MNDARSVCAAFFGPRSNTGIVVCLKLYLFSSRETKEERTERGRGKIFDGSGFYYLSILRFYLSLFRLTLSVCHIDDIICIFPDTIYTLQSCGVGLSCP